MEIDYFSHAFLKINLRMVFYIKSTITSIPRCFIIGQEHNVMLIMIWTT